MIKIEVAESKNRDIFALILGGLILGIGVFLAVYGYRILDVTYDDWLFTGGDISQHYVGWLYYRNSSWHMPIGLIDGLTDTGTSIIYTDSIPILAVFFKLFSAILPKTFQYFGIWAILSFALMGILSNLLIYRYIKNIRMCWLGSIFFLVSPYVFQRMFAHTALAGQWIIVLAMIIWVYNVKKDDIVKKTIIWALILGLAASIHIYFVPMIVVFLMADSIRNARDSRKLWHFLVCFFVPIIWTVAVLGCLGAFAVSGHFSAEGLGLYSANINTFINANFLNTLFSVTFATGAGQYEGVGYLGLGMIIMCLTVIIISIVHKQEVMVIVKRNRFEVLLTCCIFVVFLVLAFSPTVMLGERVLFVIPWPSFVVKLLEIFRASGRFIWPACYILFLYAFVFINRLIEKNIRRIGIVVGLCVMQILDFSPMMQDIHNNFAEKKDYVSPLNAIEWQQLCADKEKIVVIPYQYAKDNSEFMYALVKLNVDKPILFNTFYLAREDETRLEAFEEEYLCELQNGKGKDNVLYIFGAGAEESLKSSNIHLYEVDGVVVGVKQEIERRNLE